MIRYISENTVFKTGEEVKNWVDTLDIPKRKPSSISKIEHDIILGLHNIANNPDYKYEIDFRNTLLLNKSKQLRLSKEEYENIYSGRKDQPDKIKGKYATYVKNDVGSYSRFIENIKNIEDLLSSLKGYHKIPLKNLTVEFVSSSDMKTPAKYRSRKNTIWINPLSKKVGNTKEEYGSLRYIIVHELGHKFLEDKPQGWNISDPNLYTTPYSKTNPNTMTEEESFAELFALSNRKNKYKQYAPQIKEFEKRLEY